MNASGDTISNCGKRLPTASTVYPLVSTVHICSPIPIVVRPMLMPGYAKRVCIALTPPTIGYTWHGYE